MKSAMTNLSMNYANILYSKYSFKSPDWDGFPNIDPNDEYRYWADGIRAADIEPVLMKIPVSRIRQEYDGEEENYDWEQFDSIKSIEDIKPIDVAKWKNQYIILDGNHRAAVAKAAGFKLINAYVRDFNDFET